MSPWGSGAEPPTPEDRAAWARGEGVEPGEFRTLPAPPPVAAREEHCHAGKDEECNWAWCPQNREGEPAKTGRHCPLDVAAREEQGARFPETAEELPPMTCSSDYYDHNLAPPASEAGHREDSDEARFDALRRAWQIRGSLVNMEMIELCELTDRAFARLRQLRAEGEQNAQTIARLREKNHAMAGERDKLRSERDNYRNFNTSLWADASAALEALIGKGKHIGYSIHQTAVTILAAEMLATGKLPDGATLVTEAFKEWEAKYDAEHERALRAESQQAEAVQRAREEAAREERERCAKIADEFAAREQNHAHAASGGAAGVSAEIERAIRLSAITCDSCKRVAPKMDEIAAAIRRQPPGAVGNQEGQS